MKKQTIHLLASTFVLASYTQAGQIQECEDSRRSVLQACKTHDCLEEYAYAAEQCNKQLGRTQTCKDLVGAFPDSCYDGFASTFSPECLQKHDEVVNECGNFPIGNIESHERHEFEVAFGEEEITRTKAQKVCQKWGGDLVKIQNGHIQQAITQKLNSQKAETNHDYWIGLTRKESSGKWTWDDGKATQFTNWVNNNPVSAATSPSSSPEKQLTAQCAHLSTELDRKWQKADCNDLKRYFCAKAVKSIQIKVKPLEDLDNWEIDIQETKTAIVQLNNVLKEQQEASEQSNTNAAKIGGAIGGVIVLAIAITVLALCRYKKKPVQREIQIDIVMREPEVSIRTKRIQRQSEELSRLSKMSSENPSAALQIEKPNIENPSSSTLQIPNFNKEDQV